VVGEARNTVPPPRSDASPLRAHGFEVRLLARIVRAGLAVPRPEIVKAGGRTPSMLRLTITDAGRRAMEVSNEQAFDSKRVDHGRGHCWICSRSIVASGAR
jgi:hypothetical protein